MSLAGDQQGERPTSGAMHSLLARIEAVLNRGLADSTLAGTRAAALEGRRLRVQVQDSALSVVARIEDGRLRLAADDAGAADAGALNVGAADAAVTGGALSLLALAGPRRAELLRSGAVRIEGDAEIAERFQALFELIRPDIESELARLLGKTPAHALTLAAQGLRRWLGAFARRGLDNTLEYYAHEQPLLVPRAEADQQQRAAEALRDRLALLEARLDHLPAPRGAASGDNSSRGAAASGAAP